MKKTLILLMALFFNQNNKLLTMENNQGNIIDAEQDDKKNLLLMNIEQLENNFNELQRFMNDVQFTVSLNFYFDSLSILKEDVQKNLDVKINSYKDRFQTLNNMYTNFNSKFMEYYDHIKKIKTYLFSLSKNSSILYSNQLNELSKELDKTIQDVYNFYDNLEPVYTNIFYRCWDIFKDFKNFVQYIETYLGFLDVEKLEKTFNPFTSIFQED